MHVFFAFFSAATHAAADDVAAAAIRVIDVTASFR